jgi:hypothetical protein
MVQPAAGGSAPTAQASAAGPAAQPKKEVLQKDLPAISADGKDPYEKIELSLPFYRTPIKVFEANVDAADKACGEEGIVTIAELAKVFTSGAWAQLTQDDSRLCKVLLHQAFKSEKCAPDQISVEFLKCMGLIHCGGSPREKAEYLYNLLQDGGLSAHTFISAADKDLEPTFEKICLLATVHLFEWAEEFNSFEGPFKDNYDTLSGAHEDLREDVFLEAIYGNENKLDNDVWLKNITDKAKWVFTAKEVRKQVFKQVNLTYQV